MPRTSGRKRLCARHAGQTHLRLARHAPQHRKKAKQRHHAERAAQVIVTAAAAAQLIQAAIELAHALFH